jgi:chitooligosaccharide deacetylase
MARIALTFDDGPSAWTEPLLDLLAAHEAHATFFVMGSAVAARPQTLQRIVAEGHELGNHSWSHPHLARDCDDEQVRLELERTSHAIEELTATTVHRFRCPYYDVDARVEAVAATLGLTHTRGDLTPPDWRAGVRSGFLATLVLQLARDEEVLGLHDGIPPDEQEGASRAVTVEAVATFLPRLRERGYECVTASSLLGTGAADA